jgi:hypothetical protein
VDFGREAAARTAKSLGLSPPHRQRNGQLMRRSLDPGPSELQLFSNISELFGRVNNKASNSDRSDTAWDAWRQLMPDQIRALCVHPWIIQVIHQTR